MFRDSEIEQPDRSVGPYENVGRFQIAMYHGITVRVLHRLTDLAKQLQTPLEGAFVLHAVVGQRQAFHVLHNEERRAIGKRVCVVKPGDRRMIELCERALLGCEALPARRREPGIAQQFESNQTTQVRTLGKIDHSHPAFAQYLANAVGAQFLEGWRLRALSKDVVRDVGKRSIKE